MSITFQKTFGFFLRASRDKGAVISSVIDQLNVGDLSAHFSKTIKFCSAQLSKKKPVNAIPCCRQSS